jgi:hypothetical protein
MVKALAAVALLGFGSVLAMVQASFAAGETPSEIPGRWALSHVTGAKLPTSSCKTDSFDTFIVDTNGFVWLPPDSRHLPSLVLKITSQAGNVLQVADQTGITGTISVSGNLLTQIYSNGVALIFDRCP